VSIMNFGVTPVNSCLIFGWSGGARRPAVTASRGAAAVVAFFVVGLTASLLFVLFVPGGVAALIALMP
jgi:hypothetical protein